MSRGPSWKSLRTRRDVVVVGAGAAGVGMGVALTHAGVEDVLIVDRHGVGASFERWPKEMQFITPSFPTNSIGMLDLNAVALGTSPAHTLGVEHPSGTEYAAYLRRIAEHFELAIKTKVDVASVRSEDAGFVLETNHGPVQARYVVWAAGEFQYPRLNPFPGADLCRHNATVESWSGTPGDEAIVVGGYESGVDAAIHLSRLGRKVTLLDRAAPWDGESSDPSVSLSTYTVERLRAAAANGRICVAGESDVSEVRRWGRGYEVATVAGRVFRTRSQPILATGFHGSVSLIADLFEPRDDGLPLLNEHDESTLAPGLFLSGPMVRHDKHVFCFIYKFRQRFAVVAKAIATRLGLPAAELEKYRPWGMFLDDLSCCGEECAC